MKKMTDSNNSDTATLKEDSEKVIGFDDMEAITDDTIAENDASTDDAPLATDEVDALGLKHSYRITNDWKTVVSEHDPDETVLSLPPHHLQVWDRVLSKAPNVDMTSNDSDKAWARTIVESARLNLEPTENKKEPYRKTLEELEDFQQEIGTDTIPIKIKRANFDNVKGQELSGTHAMHVMFDKLGIGNTVRVPLWHSGAHLYIRPSTDLEDVELNRSIAREKISLARQTKGLVLSNIIAYTSDRLLASIRERIEETSINFGTVDPYDHLLFTDIPKIIIGALAASHPDGIAYSRSCINNVGKCSHVEKGRLNFDLICHVSKAALDPKQITYMRSTRSNARPIDHLKTYQENGSRTREKNYTVVNSHGKEVVFTLKVCTINEYLDSGSRWFSEVSDTKLMTLTEGQEDAELNAYSSENSKATIMRQYSHIVKMISIDDNEVSDITDIEKMLNVMGADKKLRNGFIDACADFISDATLEVIGVEAFNCPACNAEQKEEIPVAEFENIVPIDPVECFFLILGAEYERIRSR